MEKQGNSFKRAFFGLIVATAGMVGSPVWAETYLLMAEEAGCMWCARWNRDVSTEYPLTAEGRAAPLRRVDIHGDLPEGLILAKKLVYTPTFVLVRDGEELSRIEGYPGEDFFWGLLNRMLKEAGEPAGAEG